MAAPCKATLPPGEQLFECAVQAGFGTSTHIHGVGDGAQWIADQVEDQFGAQGSYLLDFWPATVTVEPTDVTVRFHRRAHLPIIIDSGILDSQVKVPWWNGATLRMLT